MAIQDRTIYPTDFFNIPHPTSPLVSIQFRTKVNKNTTIDDPSLWESITFDPNNFFNEVTIEDDGGAATLDLTLQDKNYAWLEDKVVDMMTAQKLSNDLVGNKKISRDDTGYFEFFMDKKKTANVRVRFGYSEWGGDYISDVDLEGEDFANRHNSKKPVIRSPWIYFMITSLDMNITDNGLQVTMGGRNPLSSFFNKAKMIQKYAKLTGTPKNIINNICKQIKKSSEKSSNDGSSTIDYEIIDEPLMYQNRDGEQKIEVLLGNKPIIKTLEDGSRKVEPQYQNVSSLLDQICRQISPIMYDENGNKISISKDGSEEGKEVDGNSEKMKETYSYTYSFIRKKDKDVIEFHYKDPRKALDNQPKLRTYSWIEHGMSIIQNLDLTANSLFAQLNLPIMTKGEDGNSGYYVSTPNKPNDEKQETKTDTSLGSIKNVSKALESEEFQTTFTAGTLNTSEFETSDGTVTSKMAAKRMMRNAVSNINEQIIDGSITIQGDPFYLFDNKIRKFSYLINVIIKRPNYIDKNGELIEGGRSYMSGLFMIKKITHKITFGNYTTTLEIKKAPF